MRKDVEDVLEQVVLEREKQVEKGYTTEHDDKHILRDFAQFINRRVMRKNLTRQDFIEVAALAVAAVEKIDRHS